MILRYDDDFLEGAVFLCARGKRPGVPPAQIARFQREREALYRISNPDDRNAAFFRLHLEWFREWGLEEELLRLLREFPILDPALRSLSFRKSRHSSDEGAELYVHDSAGRNAVVALRLERLAAPDRFQPFLRHEFTHLEDMVNPAFGYAPVGASLNGAQDQLTRQRYRLLWDITIDGRLAQLNRRGQATREPRWAEFDRAYSFWPEAKRTTMFEDLWTNTSPQHRHLIALASDPRDLSAALQPLPGAPCPLCHFPTFAWAADSDLSQRIQAAIRVQFSDWQPSQGACLRCVEMFEATVQFPPPATVCL